MLVQLEGLSFVVKEGLSGRMEEVGNDDDEGQEGEEEEEMMRHFGNEGNRKSNLLEALDVAILLQRGKNDVKEPESEEHAGRNLLAERRSAQLATGHLGATADYEEEDGDDGENAEDGETESERSWRNFENIVVGPMIDSGHGPRHANSEEDVDAVGSGHVAD